MDLHQYLPGSMAGGLSLALRGWKCEADLHLEIDDRSGSTTRHQQPNTRMFFFRFQPVDIAGIFMECESYKGFFGGISSMVMFDFPYTPLKTNLEPENHPL